MQRQQIRVLLNTVLCTFWRRICRQGKIAGSSPDAEESGAGRPGERHTRAAEGKEKAGERAERAGSTSGQQQRKRGKESMMRGWTFSRKIAFDLRRDLTDGADFWCIRILVSNDFRDAASLLMRPQNCPIRPLNGEQLFSQCRPKICSPIHNPSLLGSLHSVESEFGGLPAFSLLLGSLWGISSALSQGPPDGPPSIRNLWPPSVSRTALRP